MPADPTSPDTKNRPQSNSEAGFMCGIVTNYRTFLADFLAVEEFCRWLDEWGE